MVMTALRRSASRPHLRHGPLLQLVFGLGLAGCRSGGWGDGALAQSSMLPVVTLALPQIAVFARLTRGSMIEACAPPYPHAARLGLPRADVLGTHAARAALPVVSYLGPTRRLLLTGSIVVETIFGLPGVGRYFVDGALNRDYTLVMGTVVLIAVFVVVFNLVVDVIYACSTRGCAMTETMTDPSNRRSRPGSQPRRRSAFKRLKRNKAAMVSAVVR
jgi:oligopeptide transport system permease protein